MHLRENAMPSKTCQHSTNMTSGLNHWAFTLFKPIFSKTLIDFICKSPLCRFNDIQLSTNQISNPSAAFVFFFVFFLSFVSLSPSFVFFFLTSLVDFDDLDNYFDTYVDFFGDFFGE